METHAKKFCPALWLSGFFALGAVVHLTRFVLGISLVVNGHEVPLSVSAVGGLVFAGLSTVCFLVSLKKPCESSKGHSAGGLCCAKK